MNHATPSAPMDHHSLELLRLLEKRASGLARKNWGHLDSRNVWARGLDNRRDEDRVADEAEFNHVCAIIDRYVHYSEEGRRVPSSEYYMTTTRSIYGAEVTA